MLTLALLVLALLSSVAVQSAVRGNSVRQSTDADTAAIRLRLRETLTNATDSDKLGNRTDEALDVLKTSSQLAVIIEACVTLGTHQCLALGFLRLLVAYVLLPMAQILQRTGHECAASES